MLMVAKRLINERRMFDAKETANAVWDYGKKTLIEKGMTQVRLAQEVGTSNKYLNLILYGDRSGDKYLPMIVKILELDPKHLKKIA